MKNLEMSYLMDFYGNLLSDKQREIMQLYYQEDLSLSEIASEYGITRQGVRDNIVRAEKELTNYEASLGLWKKFSRITQNLGRIRTLVEKNSDLEYSSDIIKLIDDVENNV